MKMSKMLMMAAILMVAVMPALAEQGWADSPDFTVNTVPEPAALLAGLGMLLLARRLRLRLGKLACAVLALLLIAVTPVRIHAAPPVVTNVTALERDPPSMFVDIYYDLSDAACATQSVSVTVSTNSGALYNVNATNFTGDVGYPVLTGVQKHIVWDAHADLPTCSSSTARVRITAYDGVAPTGMVLIPAGTFNMGTNNLAFESVMADAGPNHQVYISAFYMDKCAVSYTVWTNVYTWAIGHGYTFNNAGDGKAATHPVQEMYWYDCVKWCNARSEKEGRTPCYYTSTSFIAANIYRTGTNDIQNSWVNWTTNGYRLPTEAEWEKAVRGGTSGHRFPWSDADTIQHARANYCSYTNSDGSAWDTYDTSPTRGFHPTFNDGMEPYTSPVGYFAPNGYGLYDMVGNVGEWCWDWYDSAWYGNAGATQNDTRGPTSSPYACRVMRGDAYNGRASYSRCAFRLYSPPANAVSDIGFRCVRGL